MSDIPAQLPHTDSPLPGAEPGTFCLPTGYVQRVPPDYFVDEDEDGIVWQPDVYPYAASIARTHGCDTIIDIGCGRAEKLAALARRYPEWHYVGVDYGANIQWCREHWEFGQWVEADLEKDVRPVTDVEAVSGSVIVCSDVLEHLVRPDIAAAAIRGLLLDGAVKAVFSTPARERKVLPDQAEFHGPPDNVTHVREWASEEFRAFLRSCGLVVEDFSYTRRNDADGAPSTQLILADVHRR
ncbi:class I SAM-dependent methyltransferase [Streptomyces sp. NPDC059070]|uniref:class I SAM-dependent methyltransferase n=1 Tax=Streptomyces sp. NPDC059070 TaxID=3346713 RepID=UPI003685E5D9